MSDTTFSIEDILGTPKPTTSSFHVPQQPRPQPRYQAQTPTLMLDYTGAGERNVFSKYPYNISVENLHVVRMIVQPVDGYMDMGYRPMSIMADSRVINAVTSCLEQNGGTPHPMMLGEVAGQMFRPAYNPGRTVVVPNGWGSTRYRYVLFLRWDNTASGSSEMMVVTGFSACADTSYAGSVDPNVPFHVTSVKLWGVDDYDKCLGLREYNGIVADPNSNGINDHNRLTLVRPIDVGNVSRTMADNEFFQNEQAGHSAVHGDVSLGRRPVAVKSGHTHPTGYMHSLLNAWQTALSANEIDAMNGERYAASRSGSSGIVTMELNVPPVSDNPFLATLTWRLGQPTTLNTFTLNQLVDVIDPQLYQKLDTSMCAPGSNLRLTGHMDVENPNAPSDVSSAVHIIKDGIADLMYAAGLSYINVTGSNYSDPVFIDTPRSMLGQMDTSGMLKGFLASLKYQLFASAFRNSQEISIGENAWARDWIYAAPYEVSVRADISGDISIMARMNGGIAYPYTFPLFMSGTYSVSLNDNPLMASEYFRNAHMAMGQLYGI